MIRSRGLGARPRRAGRDGEIVDFLTEKWATEQRYRLVKELRAYEGCRIAVRFAYEYHDASGRWFRAYGNENREFALSGLMSARIASINDLAIDERDRVLTFPQGRRPNDFSGLTELGL